MIDKWKFRKTATEGLLVCWFHYEDIPEHRFDAGCWFEGDIFSIRAYSTHVHIWRHLEDVDGGDVEWQDNYPGIELMPSDEGWFASDMHEHFDAELVGLVLGVWADYARRHARNLPKFEWPMSIANAVACEMPGE